MSIALRTLPSRLELNRRDGSGMLAPRAKVSFTTFVYDSPVQIIPWRDQTGVPIPFHSSITSGSASRINARMRARVSPRHPVRSRIRWSMNCEADLPVACFSSFRALTGLASRAPGPAFAAAFAGPLPLIIGPLDNSPAPRATRFLVPLSADVHAGQLCGIPGAGPNSLQGLRDLFHLLDHGPPAIEEAHVFVLLAIRIVFVETARRVACAGAFIGQGENT